jgi:endo-1,4-beta-D-glucanase Y
VKRILVCRLIATCLVVTCLIAGLAGCSTRQSVAAPAGAVAEAMSFLDRYVAPDGRVVRADQGSDTVSEGQAYGMLLAVAADDRHRFDLIWNWTDTHLRRPDKLLSWRWVDGAVADPMPAADADLDAAWALSLAASKWHEPAARQASESLASSILLKEVAAGALDAGPWAGEPSAVVVNPGYDAPPAIQEMATLTGDKRWRSVAATNRHLLDALTAGGSRLPPEWAMVAGPAVVPLSGPQAGATANPRYGLSAARAVSWLAASCSSADRSLAAALGKDLGTQPGAQERDLSGQVTDPSPNAVSYVAAAMAAAASGDPARAGFLLAQAANYADGHRSYYGDAWVAIGTILMRAPKTFDSC